MVKSPPRVRTKKGEKQNHLAMKGGEESVRRTEVKRESSVYDPACGFESVV